MAKKKSKQSKQLKRLMRDMQSSMGANATLAANQNTGLFSGLSRLLPSRRTDQFLIGLLVGAAATYVLSDEELRGKIMKSGAKLYGGMVGGLEEMKEQMADIRAELTAEQNGSL